MGCQTNGIGDGFACQQGSWLTLPPLTDMSGSLCSQGAIDNIIRPSLPTLWLNQLIVDTSDNLSEVGGSAGGRDERTFDVDILELQCANVDNRARIEQLETKIEAMVKNSEHLREDMNLRVQKFTETCVTVLQDVQGQQAGNSDLHEKLRQKVKKLNGDIDHLWHEAFPSRSASTHSESSPSSVTDAYDKQASDGCSVHSESPHAGVADHLHPYLVQNWVDDLAECNGFSNACDVLRKGEANCFTNPQPPRPGDVANGTCGQKGEPNSLRLACASDQDNS